MHIAYNQSSNEFGSLLLFHDHEVESSKVMRELRNAYSLLLDRLSKDPQLNPYFSSLKEFAASQIDYLPSFFNLLNLKIRPVVEVYHSCIITDEEVNLVARTMHNSRMANVDTALADGLDTDLGPFDTLDSSLRRFYRELFYCFPIVLKSASYEAVKPNELGYFKPEIAGSIARLLHERYRYLMRRKDLHKNLVDAMETSSLVDARYSELEFDRLPEKIKNSNYDSAYHIPTKLLSIGYTMERASRDIEPGLLILDEADVETMAKLEHERWCWEKRLSGFIYGSEKSTTTHPCLVPYDELSEFEKDKDRDQVKLYPLIIMDLDYVVRPIRLCPHDEISYIYRKPSEIEKSILILEKQSDEIARLIESKKGCGDSNDMGIYISTLKTMEKQLNRALFGFNEVRDSIRRSEYIQRSILASKLYFRSCFPDSFLLFKPLDIVSGDFYFVSQIEDKKLIAVADCTGHGISAAMLTMVCCNYLDIAINVHQLTDPAEILKFLFPRMEDFMYRQTGKNDSGDGMDIAICTLQPENNVLRYAGINRPLLMAKASRIDFLKPVRCFWNKLAVVSSSTFSSQEICMGKGDSFYLFSDGVIDQFGGVIGAVQKYGQKRFSSLLHDCCSYSMSLQREFINENIENWRTPANEPQTDDIIVVGIRI